MQLGRPSPLLVEHCYCYTRASLRNTFECPSHGFWDACCRGDGGGDFDVFLAERGPGAQVFSSYSAAWEPEEDTLIFFYTSLLLFSRLKYHLILLSVQSPGCEVIRFPPPSPSIPLLIAGGH